MQQQTKRQKVAYHGWLNLWKPSGLSSMQAVAAVRRILNAAKIGHAGTLDPAADGVLPIALGEATKLIPLLHDGLKSYRFGVNWGAQTNTDDAEGDVTDISPARPIRADIETALAPFIGDIDQIPPMFSAIKINGQRAYALARAGEMVEMVSRRVYIDQLQLIDATNPDMAVFEVVCGTGTYVRSLARDLAKNLGTLGHCAFITRLHVGKFNQHNAISLEKLEDMAYTDIQALLWPLADGLDDILAVAVTDDEALRLHRGNDVRFLSKMDAARLPDIAAPDLPILAMHGDDVVAICRLNGVTLQPTRVLNTTT